MAYSTDTDLLKVAPAISGWAVESLGDDPSSIYSYHRDMAYADINNRLRGKTAIPVSTSDATVASGLAEVESRMTAARIVKANSSKFNNTDRAEGLARMYEQDAQSLFDNLYIPASASTPAQSSTFTGDGTISVTVNDAYAYRADFVVKCVSAGTDTAIFEIEDGNARSGGPWNYHLENDSAWPSATDIEGNSARDTLKAVTIVLTTGATAWAKGDYWTFSVYPSFKSNRKAKLGWIPLQRA